MKRISLVVCAFAFAFCIYWVVDGGSEVFASSDQVVLDSSNQIQSDEMPCPKHKQTRKKCGTSPGQCLTGCVVCMEACRAGFKGCKSLCKKGKSAKAIGCRQACKAARAACKTQCR